MKKVQVSSLKINDSILATVTSDGKSVYGTFKTPLTIDTIFMSVKIRNAFPSDNVIRFNVNNTVNAIFPEIGCVSFLSSEYVWIAK